MSNTRIIATAAAIALLSGLAAASSDDDEREAYYQRGGPMPFEVFDLDRDGVVSAEEYQKVHGARYENRMRKGYPVRGAAPEGQFDQIDSDADGSISRDEMHNWRSQRYERRYEHRRGKRWDD